MSASTLAVFGEMSIDLDGVPVANRPDVESFRSPFHTLAGEMMDVRAVDEFVPAEDGSTRGIVVMTHVRRYSYAARGMTATNVNLTLSVEVRVYDVRDVQRTSRFDALRQATVAVLDTGAAATIARSDFDLSIDVRQAGSNRVQVWHNEIAPEVARQILVTAAPTLQQAIEVSQRPRDAASAPADGSVLAN